MDKIVYEDSGVSKVLRGIITDEEEGFLKVRMPDNTVFEINKRYVRSVKRGFEDEKSS